MSLRRATALPLALAADRSGLTAIATGLLLTTLMGFSAVAIDLGVAYSAKRSAQNAADSAAFSAAVGEMSGASNVTDQAQAVAAQYGFTNGAAGASVAVNTPPTSGAFTSNAQAVEVIVTRPAARFFGGFLSSASNTVRGRAVAVAGVSGDACVLAFDPTGAGAALEVGTADVNLVGCSLFANSNNGAALELKGGSALTAKSVGVVGGASVGNNANLNTTNGLHTGQTALSDPYANVAIPSYSGCTYNSASPGSNATYSSNGSSPTVFCNGLSLNAGVTVTLNPGIYIIDRGALTVNGGATLQGTGVTIVLTSSTGSNYATTTINGNSTVNLSAPTSGPTAGLVFYQDRRAASGGGLFNGGSSQSLRGAVYFPNQLVTFTGGSVTGGGCTQILAYDVDFKGNSNLEINCQGSGVKSIGGYSTKLVE